MGDIIVKKYKELMELLSPCKQPMVAYYSDEKPQKYIGPKEGFCIECDDLSEVSSEEIKIGANKHSCAFCYLVNTVKKGVTSVFEADNFGCGGAKFAFGFSERLCGFNYHFLSTGVPGFSNGERYVKKPEDAEKFFSKPLEGRKAKGKYLIFQRFDKYIDTNMNDNLDVELVIFMVNPEILSGLVTLARFSGEENNIVETHFAAGCANMFAWPMINKEKGKESVEVGFYDLTGRPFLEPYEMTISIPYQLFLKMLDSYNDSFLTVEAEKHGPPKWWDLAKKRSKGSKTSFMMQVITKLKTKFSRK